MIRDIWKFFCMWRSRTNGRIAYQHVKANKYKAAQVYLRRAGIWGRRAK